MACRWMEGGWRAGQGARSPCLFPEASRAPRGLSFLCVKLPPRALGGGGAPSGTSSLRPLHHLLPCEGLLSLSHRPGGRGHSVRTVSFLHRKEPRSKDCVGALLASCERDQFPMGMRSSSLQLSALKHGPAWAASSSLPSGGGRWQGAGDRPARRHQLTASPEPPRPRSPPARKSRVFPTCPEPD